jgi:hypothetical protein
MLILPPKKGWFNLYSNRTSVYRELSCNSPKHTKIKKPEKWKYSNSPYPISYHATTPMANGKNG